MISESPAEPRILVTVVDRWICVLVCAELRERGKLAKCTPRLAVGLLLPDPGELGPVAVVLCERRAIGEHEVMLLRWLRAFGPGPSVVLLSAADAEVPTGPWDRVIRRPITIGEVADVVEQLANGGAPNAREDLPGRGIRLRLGPPWPAVTCIGCRAARHGEPARTAAEQEALRRAFAEFALQHVRHEP